MDKTKEIMATVLVLLVCSVMLASTINSKLINRVQAETIPQVTQMIVTSTPVVGSEVLGLVK